MPAGNDAAHAAAELADRFGAGTGGAEDLIDANDLKFTQQLIAANQYPSEPELTKEVDRGAVASAFEVDEEKVKDVAVRGRYVTAVLEDEIGRYYKVVLPHEGEGKIGDPFDTDQPNVGRLAAQAKRQQEVTAAAKEAADIVTQALADTQEKADEVIRKATENAEKIIKDATDKAESHGTRPDGTDGGSQTPPADKKQRPEGESEPAVAPPGGVTGTGRRSGKSASAPAAGGG
jgi:hypothetical protein